MTHRFGLTAVVAAVVTCAAAAAIGIARRNRRSGRRATPQFGGWPGGRGSPRNSAGFHSAGTPLRSSGRGGGGGGLRGGASAGAGRGRAASGLRSGGGGLPGAASRKPVGMLGKPLPLTSARNQAGPPSALWDRGAAAMGGPGRPMKPASPAPSPRNQRSGVGPSGVSAGSRSGPAGLLPRTLGRKNAPPSGGRHPVGGAGLGKGHHKVAPQTGAAPQDGRGKKPSLLDKAARRNRDNDAGVSPRPDRLNARPKKPHKKKNKNKGKPARKKNPTTLTKQQAPDRASTRAAMSWRRRAQYRAGRFLRQHTSAFTRQRIRSATGAARAAGRTVSRYGSPLLAHGLRYGSRALLRAHMALGTIRFSTLGPNWVRPLAKVLHLITTPAARALAWTGTWGWLNRWMYQHTSTQPAGPPRTRRAASTGHRPVTSPGTTGASSSASASSSKGNSSVSYGLEHTLPLRYAAETVRNAGAMMVLNPADNMVGYEATIRALTAVQRAIGDVIRMAAVSSRENFKVNEAIPEAYDDTAVYAYALAGRLESIPTLYRIIHAEQIDNIENPTPQGAKWDQAANQ